MPITVTDLDNLITEYHDLKQEYAKANKVKNELDAQVKLKGEKIAETLQELGKTSYKGPTGTFSWRTEHPFKVPSTLEDKLKFFDYLRDKGIFEEMATVNSQTLNSWAKKEEEAHDDLDFQIPGLEKGATRLVCSFRKG